MAAGRVHPLAATRVIDIEDAFESTFYVCQSREAKKIYKDCRVQINKKF